MSLQSAYVPLPPKVNLTEVDHDILRFWQERDVFGRSVAQTGGGPEWVFYEGPPTANGMPGTHHIEARVFKDVFPRFRTMRGYHVPRRAGWDCHGLPVELAVEKELGINGKPEIEKVGIAEFNARCRESVTRYIGDFEALTTRMGFWTDLSDAYFTMTPEYIDSVWWALKQIWDQGLLEQDYRVAPYCPRCGTGLSDHEVAQGYQTDVDPSIYVRMPLLAPLRGFDDVHLLIWTTTPWTLPSNTAVAVHPDVDYVIARTGDGTFVVAAPLVTAALGDDAQVLATIKGSELENLHYRPPFELADIPGAHIVVNATYVTTEEGTGLVHQAPAFGADDLAVIRQYGLPVVNPVGPDGTFLPGLELVGGVFFKTADPILVKDLRERGLLLREQSYQHQYPHCWRCHTPLMYYAQQSWYIRTTQRIDALKRENERTTWYPGHIKHGRYGDWLNNNIDWALSRSRYWGTPLPVWRCPDGHLTVAGSRSELSDLTGTDLSGLDPHRPFIDEITFACTSCGQTAVRVPEVIDAWFDSGSMPFAGVGYPYAEGSKEAFESSYPAQFICEAIDQTRGWFYTLMAVGTLVFDRSSYENVVCLGHIVAEDGRKMSKHLGNVLAPIPLMERHGADALRWFMLCNGSPWASRRIGDGPLEEIVRKVLLTYWNTASFFTLYASASRWSPASAAAVAQRPVNDRWLLAELDHVIDAVTTAMENFDTAGSGRLLAQFVDDLSNWYVRRSRSRFWAGDAHALTTLYECLDGVTRLLAPFIPFVTERVWQSAIRPGSAAAAESVHLASWPVPDEALADEQLRADMDLTRRLVEVGRSARKATNIRTRQPLSRALVSLQGDRSLSGELVAEIAEELNVREVMPLSAAGEVVDITVRANFRELGKRFGRRTQAVANAVLAGDHDRLVSVLKSGGTVTVDVDGEPVEVGLGDVTFSEVPRTGWAVSTQQDLTVALDTTITPELRQAGLAREFVRLVQAARKDAGFDVADRVLLSWAASGETAEAIRAHAAEARDAVLAVGGQEYAPDDLPSSAAQSQTGVLAGEELDVQFWLDRAPVG